MVSKKSKRLYCTVASAASVNDHDQLDLNPRRRRRRNKILLVVSKKDLPLCFFYSFHPSFYGTVVTEKEQNVNASHLIIYVSL